MSDYPINKKMDGRFLQEINPCSVIVGWLPSYIVYLVFERMSIDLALSCYCSAKMSPYEQKK
jgi:hypothetical protein